MSNDDEIVKQVVMEICGSNTVVKKVDFDKNAYLIDPCSYDHFNGICRHLKGSGHHVQLVEVPQAKGVICNIGKF